MDINNLISIVNQAKNDMRNGKILNVNFVLQGLTSKQRMRVCQRDKKRNLAYEKKKGEKNEQKHKPMNV